MELKFVEIQTFVSDLKRAREFYEGILGLPLKKHSDQFAMYELGGSALVVSAGAAQGSVPKDYGTTKSTAVVFLCENITATIAKLKHLKVPIIQNVQEFPEGKLAVISDPDGNLIELIG